MSEHATLDPAAERELRALDDALAGRPVEPDLADLADLALELRDMRPRPEEGFAADLDERTAAGFGGERGGAADLFRSLADAPRRRLLPALAATTAAIVLGAGLVASIDEFGESPSDQPVSAQVDSPGAAESAPVPQPPQASAAAAEAEPAIAPDSQGLTAGGTDRAVLPGRPDTGPFAAQRDRRAVEYSARLILGTDPENVRDVTDEVFGVVGRYRGIVLSSSISDGAEGEAGATFELLIPSTRLSAALADLSEIAEVRSRQESSLDITAPTITVRERLQDARAEVEGLLKQLADADTDEERAAVKAQLAFQRQRVAALRASLNDLQRRANLSRVSLEVVTGEEDSFLPGGEDDEWTLGDAVDDAGRVLAVSAGIALVGLAVAGPIGLIVLLAWLARRSAVRRSREQALEG